MSITIIHGSFEKTNNVLQGYARELSAMIDVWDTIEVPDSAMGINCLHKISLLSCKIIELTTHGSYLLRVNENEKRNDVLKYLSRADKVDSRFTAISSCLKDLRGADQAIPDLIISPDATDAIRSLHGVEVVCDDQSSIYLQVSDEKDATAGPVNADNEVTQMLQKANQIALTESCRAAKLATATASWKTYQKYTPFFAAFTPCWHGHTSKSFTHTTLGKIMQVVLGLLLSPLLLTLNLLYLLVGGAVWYERIREERQRAIEEAGNFS